MEETTTRDQAAAFVLAAQAYDIPDPVAREMQCLLVADVADLSITLRGANVQLMLDKYITHTVDEA